MVIYAEDVVQTLCITCTCDPSLWVHMCIGQFYLVDLVFFLSFNPSGSYSFLPPIPRGSLSPEDREFIKDILFMTECPKSVIPCLISGPDLLSLFVSAAWGNFSETGWERYWSISIVEYPWKWFCSNYFFRTVTFGFTHWILYFLVPKLWGEWFQFPGLGLK